MRLRCRRDVKTRDKADGLTSCMGALKGRPYNHHAYREKLEILGIWIGGDGGDTCCHVLAASHRI
jgi:hypothetical protein